jgi:paraquat-inducible protein B
MENNNQNSMPEQVDKQKHMKPFWPIFLIIVVALIAGGIIMYYVSDTQTQDDINSIFFLNNKGKNITPTEVPSLN